MNQKGDLKTVGFSHDILDQLCNHIENWLIINKVDIKKIMYNTTIIPDQLNGTIEHHVLIFYIHN